jgi:hypothetical protein
VQASTTLRTCLRCVPGTASAIWAGTEGKDLMCFVPQSPVFVYEFPVKQPELFNQYLVNLFNTFHGNFPSTTAV